MSVSADVILPRYRAHETVSRAFASVAAAARNAALRAQIEIDRERNADYARRGRAGESLTAFLSRTRCAGQDL